MRIGTLKSFCIAAVTCSLAVPVVSQAQQPAADPNAPRSVERQIEGVPGQPGTTVRPQAPGVPPSGTIVEEESTLDETRRGQTRTANFPPGQGEVRAQLGDQALVRWIAACNEAEIRVNEAAQQQAESDQVKQFAATMIKDHGMLGDKLRQAGSAGREDRPDAPRRGDAIERNVRERDALNRDATDDAPDARPRRPEARPGTRNNDAADDNQVLFQPGAQPGATRRPARSADDASRGMRGGNPVLMFHEEVTKQCTETTIAALKEKKGADFDHAFMHQQVMAHMSMLDTLKVAGNHASPELKPTLDEAAQHTQAHLDEAKQILEQLENK